MYTAPGFAVQNIVVALPHALQVQALGGHRYVYFETSREGVIDREGEDIASDALWRSRELFLDQGDLDISHFAHLGNPMGSGGAPEYVVGRPVDVKRSGKSIFVKGDLFSSFTPPPEGSSGDWANRLWHGLTEMQPAMRWFPSVFGKIRPGGIEMSEVNGRIIRKIVDLDWFSVGFALRAQHPALGPISTDPSVGHFAKADSATRAANLEQTGTLSMNWQTFAKAVSSGVAVTSSEMNPMDRQGVAALQPSSQDGTYHSAKNKVLKRVLSGRVKPMMRDIAKAFQECSSCDDATAEGYAKRLLTDSARKLS